AFEQGAAGPEGKKSEQMIEAADVGRRRHGAGSEQRPDLPAEKNEVAPARPVERADAHAIARPDHGALGAIEQREGKLALQMREQIRAVLLVEMHDQLAIAAGAELMTSRLKLGLALRIVEQLAVAQHGDGAVLVEDRLLAVAQPDDAKPLRRGA